MFVLDSLSNYQPSPWMDRSQSHQNQGNHHRPQGEINFNLEVEIYLIKIVSRREFFLAFPWLLQEI